MNSGSSNSIVARIFGWLRGMIIPKDAGQRQASNEGRAPGGGVQSGDASHQAARDQRGAGDITGTPGGTSAAPASERQVLPDLDDSEGDYEYAGEPGGANRPPEQAGTGGPASRAAEEIESYHSDIADAGGDFDEEEASYPTGSDDVSNLHDAVGGHDEGADQFTDGIIDTSRETSASATGQGVPSPDNVPETDHDEPGVSEQDELTAFEGARNDEFAAGGYTPKPVDQEDIEAAAEGAPTNVPRDDSPENLANQHRMSDSNTASSTDDNVREVEEYNYGLGDLGAGRSGSTSTESESTGGPSETAQPSAANQTPSQPTDRPGTGDSGKRGVSREEIESTAAGDAFGQGDEAVTAPGQSAPEDFTEPEIGTVEPSRSATGNDVDDDEQDALGTTLDYTADEADSFDTDEANLSGQEELSVIDGDNAGDDDRNASFEGGTAAQATAGIGEAQATTDETRDSYADFPDEPEAEHTDESGLDDFAGSDYPSDRRVDPLAGDDAFDAMQPDEVNNFGSSSGDLDTADEGEELLINQLDEREGTGGDTGIADRAIDQDNVGTSDEHVGGEEPAFVENLQDNDAGSGETDDTTTTAAASRDKDSERQNGNVPAGAVRGDGTTNTPEGYPVKGNGSSKIYHLPEYPSYKGTKAEFCFATEEDAIAAGFRAPGRRNRGRGRKR